MFIMDLCENHYRSYIKTMYYIAVACKSTKINLFLPQGHCLSYCSDKTPKPRKLIKENVY